MANKLSSSGKHGMIVRIITAFALVAVLLPCTVLGGWSYFVLLCFLLAVGTYELLEVPGKGRYSLFLKILTYLFVFGFFLSFFIPLWVKGLNPFGLDTSAFSFRTSYFILPMLLVVGYFLLTFLVAILSDKIQLEDVTYLSTMISFFVVAILSLAFIRYFPNSTGTILGNTYFKDVFTQNDKVQAWSSSALTLTIAVGTWSSDVGAYFVGVLFGKHPMNPRISPHKTWEGFIGGCVTSWIVFFGMSAIYEYVFNTPLVPGLLQLGNSNLLVSLNGNSWIFMAIIGFLLPIVGNLGGFLFSLIKRHYAIKDYGKIFPGHGGVIDRFDSFMTNSLMTSLLLILMANGFSLLA